MEQHIKNILGEYTFTIAALQHQVQELNRQIEDLKKNGDNSQSSATSNSE